MRPSLAFLSVPLAMLLCAATPAFADSDDSQLASLNRHLSSLTVPNASNEPKIERIAVAPSVQLPGEAAVQRPRSVAFSSLMGRPEVLHLIAAFHSVDRVMHYRGHGVDANFWGVFNRGRGLSFKYSRRF